MDTPTIHDRYVHFHGAPTRGKLLMVLSSPAVSGQTGWPIGFWLAELTHPLRVFEEAGYEVALASTGGGPVVPDSYSDPRDPSGYAAHDVLSLGYLNLPGFAERLETTLTLSEVRFEDYAGIFLVGGQGPMYTYRNNKALEALVRQFYEAGKPTGIVCHATCLLLDAKRSDGSLLVTGKTWTGFADAEEDFADQAVGARIQPYRIETEARKLAGTDFRVAGAFRAHAIADGNLITGQQQNSGAAVAEFMVESLQKTS